MNKRQILKTSCFAAGVLMLVAFPTCARPQSENSKMGSYVQSVKELRNRLFNDLNDFERLKMQHGKEADDALKISNEAVKAQIGLDAAFYFLVVDSRIQCDADRKGVRDYLKQVLYENSQRLDYETNRITGQLPFVAEPTAKQIGTEIRDDLRTTKQKLDEILGSLT
jgi:hypothetical protein